MRTIIAQTPMWFAVLMNGGYVCIYDIAGGLIAETTCTDNATLQGWFEASPHVDWKLLKAGEPPNIHVQYCDVQYS